MRHPGTVEEAGPWTDMHRPGTAEEEEIKPATGQPTCCLASAATEAEKLGGCLALPPPEDQERLMVKRLHGHEDWEQLMM